MDLSSRFYLFTKFAVPISTDGTGHLDAGWLEARWRQFIQVCVPSVFSQSDRNFKWIIAIDHRVPSWLHQELGRLDAEFSEILYAEPHELFSQAFSKLELPEKNLLSARIDSDDAIHPLFLIKARSSLRPNSVVNFPVGLRLDEDSLKKRMIIDPKGPFMAMWSTSGAHVFDGRSHKDREESLDVINVFTEQPMWMQTASQFNLSNRLKWYYPYLDLEGVWPSQLIPTLPSQECCVPAVRNQIFNHFLKSFWLARAWIIARLTGEVRRLDL